MKFKNTINEQSVASKFVEAFFDALKKNTTNRMLAKARKARMDPKVVAKLEKIQKEKEELYKLLGIDL